MMHPIIANEMAHERLREIARRADRAREFGAPPKVARTSLRAGVGLRLVRVGLRLAGNASTVALRESAESC